jgi:hypothetical protein
MNTELEARVRGVNAANQYANDLHSRLVAVFRPFVGQKILTAPGDLLARIKRLVDALDLPSTPRLHVYRDRSDYCLRYVVKSCESDGKCGHYYEASVSVGELDHGRLTSLIDAPQYRTDYVAAEVVAARETYKEAKRVADEARSALYPFGESDR